MIKLCAVLLILGSVRIWSSPLDDLASPDQAIRDAAAKTLRSTYVPLPRTKWEPLLARVVTGMSRQAFDALLKPYSPRPEGVDASGGTSNEDFRLDDAWVLQTIFDDRADKLMQAGLIERMHEVYVPPPKGYTGRWITYFPNGQKSDEIQYVNGVYFGELIAYHDDGTKSYVQHFDATGCNGDDTGYYPSGKVSYRAHYKNNGPVGIWTWYREDGSISSTQDHTK